MSGLNNSKRKNFEVSSDCCTGGSTSDLCQLLKLLSSSEQAEPRQYLGEDCEEYASEPAGKTEKRKPNFIRFGRAAASPTVFREKGVDPNFLRFGRASGAFFSHGTERSWIGSSLLFSRTMDPNFLRFGKSTEPNFLRFGRRMELSEPNFLRFGREPNEEFNRQYRKPNFLRFG
ncbi:unnamed protein product [Gongylonema pulchrum]|uniref:FMRFamide-related neuropeptides n=1 Tax=Gongylonema pulchrum TaxID=637853 RepID=A0A183CZG8_9BILA|nr:unnamed protein product [Gongylonema pulchrum]